MDVDSYQAMLQSIFGNKAGHEADDYLYEFGDPAQAILAYQIFIPAFELVENHPILPWFSSDQKAKLANQLVAKPGESAKLLASFRWWEIPYLFSKRLPTEAADVELANLIAFAWKASLHCEFPNRQWTVNVLPPEITGSVVGVGFHEI